LAVVFDDLGTDITLWFGADSNAPQAEKALLSQAQSRPDVFPPKQVGVVRYGWKTVLVKAVLRPRSTEAES
jgi:hypothetical protein